MHSSVTSYRKFLISVSLSILALVFSCLPAYTAENALPRSTPEAQGVSSQQLLEFYNAADKNDRVEFHSVMIVRHGHVIAEGWWAPYRPDLKHALYSCSKSFTAAAIGLAVSDGKISVNDKIIDIFPDELPEKISDNLAEVRIKDLLSMSVGHQSDPTFSVVQTPNWIKSFLAVPVKHDPGTVFVYNSVATYMCSAIVQKVTGKTVLENLNARIFGPLGITGADWETDLQGINTGGWGLRLKTEDLAKFGQLYLQKGQWDGKQILPPAWVAEATSMKIMQNPNASEQEMRSNDWVQGYCYQMWRSRHNSYRADGAYGQLISVSPDLDLVVAITANTDDFQAEMNFIWDYILPAIKDKPLEANPKAQKQLQAKLESLALPRPEAAVPAIADQYNGKTFTFEKNDRQLDSIRFSMNKLGGAVTLTTNGEKAIIGFGFTQWVEGTTTRKGPYLVAGATHNRDGLPPFVIISSGKWVDDKTLEITVRYIESPHTEVIRCTFDKKTVDVQLIDKFHRDGKIFKAIAN